MANHGGECLEILTSSVGTETKFDIVLMDLEMPVVDGFTAASEIRRREAAGTLSSRIPIIAVTGNARQEYFEKGIVCQAELI